MQTAAYRHSDAVVPPSSMFVLWPGDEPPLAEEIRWRLARLGHAAAAADPAAEGAAWSFWLELADRPASHLVWCERSHGAHLTTLGDVAWEDQDQRRAARDARWLVGVEGPLSLRHPAADYQLQLRLCEAISSDWSPAIYDANGFQFRTPADIARLAASRTPPRLSTLYSVHRVRIDDDTCWLHTHGLERAGVPDLELHGVPHALVGAGCELFETVAGLWMQYQTPQPETPFAVGAGIDIAWRPWQAQVEELPPDAPGGWHTRREEFGHAGFRATLVAPARGRGWKPPLEVLQRLTQSDATLFRSQYESRRMALLARERWATFGMLFAGRRPPGWRFAVKLRYADEATGQSEHLWFEALGVRPGAVHARLVSAPAFVRQLEVGAAAWHELERLSDWRIVTPAGVHDPETAEALFEAASRSSALAALSA